MNSSTTTASERLHAIRTHARTAWAWTRPHAALAVHKTWAALAWTARHTGRAAARGGRAGGRAAWWELRELGTFTRDLWRARLDDLARQLVGWLILAGLLAVAIAMLTGAATPTEVAVWAGLVYAAGAAVTAVPRARHHLRRDLRLAAQAVTRGSVDDLLPPHRRHVRQPRPRRLRWRLFTRHLESADIPVPPSWRQGREEARQALADEISWRLAPYGAYTLSWERSTTMARLHRVVELPERLDAKKWTPPRGLVLLAATEGHHRSAITVDRQPFAGWSRRSDPHLLVAGATGNGKTSMLRWLTRALHDAAEANGRKFELALLDGKGAGNGAYLANREGTIGVADEPSEWVELSEHVADKMHERYVQLRDWRYGRAPKPRWDSDIVVIVDELVDIQAIAGDQVLGPLGKIARLGRECGCTVVSSVLRPDTAEALPGIIRAQHTGRLLLGALEDHDAAKMMFGSRWRAAWAASAAEDAGIAGRGIARLGGHIYRVQLPYVPDPAENRAAADLWLPPRIAAVHDLDEARQRHQTDDNDGEQTTANPDPKAITAALPRQRRGSTAAPVDLTGTDND